MDKLQLSELIDVAAVQKMVEAHYASAGMPIGIIDAVDGSVLVAAGWQDICLKFHRAHPDSLAGCQESDRYIHSRLTLGKACKYKCTHGLWDIGIPIVVSGKHLATLFFGQFFYEDEVPDKVFFSNQAKTFGYDLAGYLAALDAVPVFKHEQVDNVLKYNTAFAAFLTDLAEQSLANKRTNLTLQESSERLSILFGKASDAIYVSRLDGQLVRVNEQACRVTGYTEDELLRLRVTDIDAEMTDPVKFKTFIESLSPGEPITLESKHRRKDGTTYPVEIKITLLQTLGEGYTIGIARDIRGRKEKEDKLRESESRYIQAQRMGKVGNWEFDLVTESFWASDEARRIFGFEPDSVSLTTEEVEKCIIERERVHQALIDLIKHNLPYNIEYEIEAIGSRKRKSIKSIAERVDDDDGNPIKVVGVVQDITERIKMEEQLQHAQKIEAIGNLAGGIAHDFNNILSPIMGYAELLMTSLPDNSLEYESAERILKAGRRGSALVKQILAFSRQYEHEMIPVQMKNIVQEVIKLGRPTIPANIEIIQNMEEDCGLVVADPTQLYQVAMNLLTNAFQSIGQNDGVISIELKEMLLEGSGEGPDELKNGSYAVLSVSDTGCGIEPEVIGNIFEPYFTTKEQGKGTGLGLAVVYGIVKAHKGDILVYSELGKGTRFSVFLPIIQTTQRRVETTIENTRYPTGTEHLLIVDDEQAIVDLEAQILHRLGYHITSLTSSIDALKVFAAHPEAFDLVITDMTMPQMTGDQLIRELHAIKPDLPVIVCTGFSERMQKTNAAAMGANIFLTKPVSTSELAVAIREALDKHNL
ncbi:PocR ligand-binding domain-containing protein [Desulfosediminicola flagellatus]|uniref:PocR ligand-binding domain-containing protein n=1 Tax=Desulfosediminicola flagellatus TaxID=2569541 RepID=UPI00142F125A|nr:PocR ligand-binding domain-containing protein [Desulfosediminicola flagellatus]